MRRPGRHATVWLRRWWFTRVEHLERAPDVANEGVRDRRSGGVCALGSVVDGRVGRGVFIDGWARARARFNHRARHDYHGWPDVCDRGAVRVTE